MVSKFFKVIEINLFPPILPPFFITKFHNINFSHTGTAIIIKLITINSSLFILFKKKFKRYYRRLNKTYKLI